MEKDVKYLSKNFTDFKEQLVNFTKQYFPNTYTDFNESDPGMMFLEMSAVVGDVLSFYTDYQFKESLLSQAGERKNIYDIATTLGYKPKNNVPSTTTLNIYQLVPSRLVSGEYVPDYRYALRIKSGMVCKAPDQNVEFRTTQPVDFQFSSSIDTTDVTIYQADSGTGAPLYYLLTKKVPVVSGTLKSVKFTFNEPVPFDKITITDTNIIGVDSVSDDDGETWYEVPYLAQETIYEDVPNITSNDPELSVYRDSAPYLLKLKRTAKRFVTRFRSDGALELQFGPGISSNNDEEIIPNPDNVSANLVGFKNSVDLSIDPSNFLHTRTYGQAPANIEMTVNYTVGGSVKDNVPANTITKIRGIEFDTEGYETLDQAVLQQAKDSVAIKNLNPATGGKSLETVDEIRQNALSYFATQNRAVTAKDYITRVYALPPKFGSVAKAYIMVEDNLVPQNPKRIPNPLAMNLYVLGYNENKQFTQLNTAVKENLQTYLDEYRIVTDAINIRDAFIVNIGVDFEISVLPRYNANEVLLRAIQALKTYFDPGRWQIKQPILESEVINTIANVKGVQNVRNMKIYNLFGDGYSRNYYDIRTATRDGVIYPSLDPSIFEVKYPDRDIKGRVVNY